MFLPMNVCLWTSRRNNRVGLVRISVKEENAFFMQLEVGKILEGKVTGITAFGAFVELGEGTTGMVHISEVSNGYVKEISDYMKEGDTVKVKVLKVGDDGKISLSVKQAQPKPEGGERRGGGNRRPQQARGGFDRPKRNEPMSFEDMLNKFKQSSEEKMSDIKRNMDGKRGSSYSRRGGNRG